MTDREKLIELLDNVGSNILQFPTDGFITHLAEFLLASGVTFAKDTETCGKWISVEDRLPEPSTYVLVLTAPGTLSLGKNFVVADYIHAKQEKYGMFIKAYSGYSDDNILNVTHWMMLPDLPPKEEEQ